jgi:hypothetical protein
MANDTGLRELMEAKFEHMEGRIDDLRSAIEKLTVATVRSERFDSALIKIGDLQTITKQTDGRLDDIEKRQDAADGQAKVYKYIGGVAVTIATALVIAWLAGMI